MSLSVWIKQVNGRQSYFCLACVIDKFGDVSAHSWVVCHCVMELYWLDTHSDVKQDLQRLSIWYATQRVFNPWNALNWKISQWFSSTRTPMPRCHPLQPAWTCTRFDSSARACSAGNDSVSLAGYSAFPLATQLHGSTPYNAAVNASQARYSNSSLRAVPLSAVQVTWSKGTWKIVWDSSSRLSFHWL